MSPMPLPRLPRETAEVAKVAISARPVEDFCAVQQLKLAPPAPYHAQARAASPLPASLSLAAPGTQAKTEQGTTSMRMISERAIALLLALAASGAAFNVLIV
jgi:hypothetical protein